jgi:hypothetical protein
VEHCTLVDRVQGWGCYSPTVRTVLLSHLLRRLISKVRNVLEAQLPQANPGLKAPRSAGSVAEAITLRTDQRQFDSFLRSIGHMSSLLDARRLKSDITSEIRRTRALLGMSTSGITRGSPNDTSRSCPPEGRLDKRGEDGGCCGLLRQALHGQAQG